MAAHRAHEEKENIEGAHGLPPQDELHQVDRLLDPKNDITLSSLQRAAAMVGRRVMAGIRNGAVIPGDLAHPQPILLRPR